VGQGKMLKRAAAPGVKTSGLGQPGKQVAMHPAAGVPQRDRRTDRSS
jgi:hypothetical protein